MSDDSNMCFMCVLCDKQFSNRKGLYRHKITVHEDRKYTCDVCDKVFLRKDVLTKHKLTHARHIELGEQRTYTCDFCDKVFLRKDILTKHKLTHARHLELGRQIINSGERVMSPSNENPRKKTKLQRQPQTISKTASCKRTLSPSTEKPRKTNKLPSQVQTISNTLGSECQVTTAELPKDTHATTSKKQPVAAEGNQPMYILPPADQTFPSDDDLPTDPVFRHLYRKNWHQIRTRYTRGKIQNQHNFRLTSLGFTWFQDVVKAIFLRQKTVFKLNFSFGCILRDKETQELLYFYSCCNNGRFMEEPALIRNEADLDVFLNKFQEFDFLEAARATRPSSKYIVEVIPNLTFYVTRVLDHPIGSPVVLPDYVINNRGLVALIGSKHGAYTDKLCFFRCLAMHKTKGNIIETTAQHLFQVYLMHKKMTAGQFKGILMTELVELEPLFETSFFVYELKENNDGVVIAELMHRSYRKYEPVYLNLFDAHFSYVNDLSTYSHSFSCRNCGSMWKDTWTLQRHEMTCVAGTKQMFPGGVYEPTKTIFEDLEDELSIVVDEDDRYFPYRATFDYEAILRSCHDHEKNSKTIEWTSEHVPVSVAIASNIPGFIQPVCYVSTGDINKLITDFLNYLNTLSAVSYQLLSEKFAWVIDKLNQLLEAEGSTQTKTKSVVQKLLDRFQAYLKELIVVGMNSGSYDLPMIKKYFFPALLQNDRIHFVVKRDASYLCVKTETLKFLDMSNYLAAGSSYENFLTAYGNQDKGEKLFFPYEWLKSLENLDETCLPPHEAFYSSLKDSNITSEQYSYCQQLWDFHNMQTMKDFLVLYNNHDVAPFGFALENVFTFYKTKQLDIFKEAISLPGITLRYLFRNLDSCTFSLFSEKRKNLYRLYKDNIVGGPSIVFHRYHEANVTFIRDIEMREQNLSPKVCKRILGFDANALYLSALAKPMPTGFCIYREAETGFKRDRDLPPGTSFACRDWLTWRAHETKTHIRHKFNGEEKRIGPLRLFVDGFDGAKVYQFNGCYFHAHDCWLTAGKVISHAEERRIKTIQNAQYFRSLGYELEQICECEWLTLKKANPYIKQFLKETVSLPLEEKFRLTEKKIIESILSDELFGVIECDVNVPSHLYQYFSELPPIFKNTDVTPADAGPFMEKFAWDNKLSFKPRRMLISSMHGQKILLATPVVKWYLNHGLQITKIYQVVQYKPEACFESFAAEVSDARRAGDNDATNTIVAESMKLIGNASYGKTVTNKERHRNVYYCNDIIASRKVNSANFRTMDEISEECYEVSMSKTRLKLDLPLHIGFFVYQMAKLRMLEFYYDFLLRYVDRADFALCQTDTDSYYMAISSDTFEDIIKPTMKEDYRRERHLWFPRNDTPEHKAYDKRTPGLFKEEFSGTGIVSLCSKTYYCYSENDRKFSCKGVSRRHTDINKSKYLDVLTNKVSTQGVNNGFRMVGNTMHTYVQKKDAFSYYYAKRKVLSDGVTTTYLDL